MKFSWQEIELQFKSAADYLEGIFSHTIRICELFEQLNKEVVKTCESDDQFFTRTNECLEILHYITRVEDPNEIPPDALARATRLFMQAQYMLTVISQVMDLMVESPKQTSTATPTAVIPNGSRHRFH